MTKIELIDKLEDIKNNLDDMIEYLKEPCHSNGIYKNETLKKHIGIYRHESCKLLGVMAELVRNYGDDNLHQTALEYQKSKEEQK